MSRGKQALRPHSPLLLCLLRWQKISLPEVTLEATPYVPRVTSSRISMNHGIIHAPNHLSLPRTPKSHTHWLDCEVPQGLLVT